MRTHNQSALLAALAFFGPPLIAPSPTLAPEPDEFASAFTRPAFAEDNRFAENRRLASIVDRPIPVGWDDDDDEEDEDEDDDDFFADDDEDEEEDDEPAAEEEDEEDADDEEDDEAEELEEAEAEYTVTATVSRRQLRELQALMN